VPSLSKILEDTYLLTADPAAKPSRGPSATQSLATWTKGTDPETNRIWSFELAMPTTSTGPKVTKLKCRTREFNDKANLVAEEISWSPIKVKYKVAGKDVAVELPLTSNFMLRHFNSDEGHVDDAKAASSKFWKLGARTDVSFQTVFGYHCYPGGPPLGGDVVQPISPGVNVEADTFMPSKDPLAPWKFTPAPPQGAIIKVQPIRIIVVVSLLLCKEKQNWDPAGTIGAARLYPYVMVMGNHDLEVVEARYALHRPARGLTGANCHADAPGEVGSVLFTDSNYGQGLTEPTPYWNRIFDYFQLDVRGGAYKVVRRDRTTNDREPKGATGVINQWSESTFEGLYDGWSYKKMTSPHPVKKKKYQGEFDNLHIAPRMVLKGVKLQPHVESSWGMDNIAMAPFCLHDCLHVHWRWGASKPPGFDDLHLKGWSEDGKPYAAESAPMVPPNQDVTLTLQDGNSYEVLTRAYKEKGFGEAGDWQVLFHNGAAFGVWIGKFGDAGRLAPEDPPTLIEGVTGYLPWPAFYWHLRYGGYPKHGGSGGVAETAATFYERLSFMPGDLTKLRDL
jgi:hypothetical protein